MAGGSFDFFPLLGPCPPRRGIRGLRGPPQNFCRWRADHRCGAQRASWRRRAGRQDGRQVSLQPRGSLRPVPPRQPWRLRLLLGVRDRAAGALRQHGGSLLLQPRACRRETRQSCSCRLSAARCFSPAATAAWSLASSRQSHGGAARALAAFSALRLRIAAWRLAWASAFLASAAAACASRVTLAFLLSGSCLEGTATASSRESSECSGGPPLLAAGFVFCLGLAVLLGVAGELEQGGLHVPLDVLLGHGEAIYLVGLAQDRVVLALGFAFNLRQNVSTIALWFWYQQSGWKVPETVERSSRWCSCSSFASEPGEHVPC